MRLLRLFSWCLAICLAVFVHDASAQPEPPDSCQIEVGDFCTYTQGGWGQDNCRGNNVACIRDQYWYTVFPGGTMQVGGGYWIRFTSPAAVAAYLPRGSTPGVLTRNYLNPNVTTTAGVFASQVLTLQLNVSYGDAGVGNFHDLGDLLVAYGPFEGYTVDALLALANQVLGGDLSELPAGVSLSMLNDAVDAINNNFDGCSRDNGYLEIDCEECEPPTVDCWTGNPTSFIYGQSVTLCATVTNPDNDALTVTARYLFGTCDVTVPAVYANGRWCVTVPASCTNFCGEGMVIFTAIDACELVDQDTCRVNSTNTPPVVDCWSGNPGTFLWGQPLTICGQVTDAQNNVTGVTGRYTIGTCNLTVPATNQGNGRWCITVPGNCLTTCAPLRVIFTATDACGATEDDTCYAQPYNIPPQAACWSGNPTTYVPGQTVTVCAEAADLDGNLLPPVMARYAVGGCDSIVPAVQTNGRWCVTVPANCTATCAPLTVVFTATDACGEAGSAQCTLIPDNPPPVVECWTGNPQAFAWNQNLTVCAIVTDANLSGVTGRYTIGNCDVTVGAANQGGGRWCVTVPAACLDTCLALRVIFTATDVCGATADDTCYFSYPANPPVQACWSGNPSFYQTGLPVTVCATVADPDGNLTGVTGRYTIGACDITVPAMINNGTWCITVPPECTDADCDLLRVIFTATDACGLQDIDTCYVPALNQPPQVACLVPNPPPYDWGQPLLVCAVVNDPDGGVDSVLAHYSTGVCDTIVHAMPQNGLWCVVVPGACTETTDSIFVVFLAYDACGAVGTAPCVIPPCVSAPPTITCAPENPTRYVTGQPLMMCAIASDPDADIVSVTGSWAVGSCSTTVAATPSGPGRWCVTVPGNCLEGDEELNVLFTVRDVCGLVDTAWCSAIPQDILCEGVQIECSPNNPTFFYPGTAVPMCAVLTDTAGAVVAVQADIWTGTCSFVIPAAPVNGEWCVVVPEACTIATAALRVIFTAWDICGQPHVDTCDVPRADCEPPVAECWLDNPAFYEYGVGVALCVSFSDPGSDVSLVTAVVSGEVCTGPLPVNIVAPGLACVDIPPNCTESTEPIHVEFTVYDQCGLADTVECVLNPPTENECCFWCTIDPAFVSTSRMVGNELRNDMNAVLQVRDGRLHLSWNEVERADYYLVFGGGLNTPLDELEAAAFVPAGTTEWTDPTELDALPERSFYQVVSYQVRTSAATTEADRAQWEFNEGAGDTAHDYSGYGRDAWRWPICPPDWGSETDTICDEAYTEFMDFEGYVYVPERCAEHLEAENDSVFYRDRFQFWARIRIHEHPTIDSGPYYIISNHSLALEVGGGFALRIDPGWVFRNGVREWHNRLTGIVWDRDLNGGDGGWRSIISPPPTLDDTTTYSVPLNQWSCISMIVDGTNSMLLIDGRVVAAGNLRFRSDNNGVPVIIGAGYRHHTYPIEYPFLGEMDCIRITDLP